jgi:hypothetical protein
MKKLLQTAKEKTNNTVDMDPLEEELFKYGIDSPGLILQAVEKYFTGLEPYSCIFSTGNADLDTHKICNLVSKGDWKKASILLKNMKKDDIVPVRNHILAYFRTILLNSVGEKALKTSKAIKHLSTQCDELTFFLSLLCFSSLEMA